MLGILATAVGIVGLALGVFLIMQVRETSARLEQEIPENLQHIEEMTRTIRYQGEAATKVLETTRDRVGFLGTSIEQLSKKLSRRDAASSVLVVIDEDIDNQLNNAKQFVLSMQNSMRNLGSTLLLFDSMSAFSRDGLGRFGTDRSIRDESPVRSVAVGLTQTADLLDQVTQAINRLQSGQSISPVQLSQVHATLETVDRELQSIKAEVAEFSQTVGETEHKVSRMRQKSPAAVRYVSNMAVLFLICFGFSQLMLCIYGLQLITSARKSWTATQALELME